MQNCSVWILTSAYTTLCVQVASLASATIPHEFAMWAVLHLQLSRDAEVSWALSFIGVSSFLFTANIGAFHLFHHVCMSGVVPYSDPPAALCDSVSGKPYSLVWLVLVLQASPCTSVRFTCCCTQIASLLPDCIALAAAPLASASASCTSAPWLHQLVIAHKSSTNITSTNVTHHWSSPNPEHSTSFTHTRTEKS